MSSSTFEESVMENLSRFYNHGTFHFFFAALVLRPPQNDNSYTLNSKIKCVKRNWIHTKQRAVSKKLFSFSSNNEIYCSKIYHFRLFLFQAVSLISVALTFACHALPSRRKPQNQRGKLFLVIISATAPLETSFPVLSSCFWVSQIKNLWKYSTTELWFIFYGLSTLFICLNFFLKNCHHIV